MRVGGSVLFQAWTHHFFLFSASFFPSPLTLPKTLWRPQEFSYSFTTISYSPGAHGGRGFMSGGASCRKGWARLASLHRRGGMCPNLGKLMEEQHPLPSGAWKRPSRSETQTLRNLAACPGEGEEGWGISGEAPRGQRPERKRQRQTPKA